MHRHHAVGMTGQHQNWQLHGFFADRDAQQIVVPHIELRRQRKRQNRHVIPRRFQQRLGQLLQPRVVGETSVPNRRIGTKGDFDAVTRFGRFANGADVAR